MLISKTWLTQIAPPEQNQHEWGRKTIKKTDQNLKLRRLLNKEQKKNKNPDLFLKELTMLFLPAIGKVLQQIKSDPKFDLSSNKTLSGISKLIEILHKSHLMKTRFMIFTRPIYCLAQQQHEVFRVMSKRQLHKLDFCKEICRKSHLHKWFCNSAGLPFNKIGVWYIS